MLRKLLNGFLFGLGFAAAFAVAWTIYTMYIFPIMWSGKIAGIESEGHPGSEAAVVPGERRSNRNFSVFKNTACMTIPSGGGILAIAVLPASGSDRPERFSCGLRSHDYGQFVPERMRLRFRS